MWSEGFVFLFSSLVQDDSLNFSEKLEVLITLP